MKDYIRIAFTNLTHRRLRSWLTMIGIFIGIAAVVSLISVGQGLEAAIEEQFQSLGADTLIIQPRGAGFGPQGEANPIKLTTEDQDVVSKTNGVVQTASMIFRSREVRFKDEVTFEIIVGLPLSPPEERDLALRATTYQIEDGRNLESGDGFKAVLGYDYTEDETVFSRRVRIGDKLTAANNTFDVVGFLESLGNPSDDQSVIIPLETAEDVLDIEEVNGNRVRDFITAQIDPNANPASVQANVERQLRNFRDVEEGDEDFQVQTAEELLDSFNTILGVVQGVLIGIAMISLLVGGIGIMNTMYTSVLQRTKDIGIMKAIGARNQDVAKIFIIESGLLGFAGGAIGVALGYLISRGVSLAAASYLGDMFLITYFPLWLVLGGLGFSTIVGTLSGIFPALQASRKDPVESLRYE
jgi:putative ABC transport system permease protein